MSNNQETQTPAPQPRRKGLRWVWRIAVLALFIWGAYALLHRPQSKDFSGTTFNARRGNLQITVTEGGSLEAMESQQIKSQVQGVTKILSIVPEGTTVSQEDVDKGKVLVELDSKDLRDRKLAEELDYQNAAAAYTETIEEFQIQENQNRSDIMTAVLAAKFARMDFDAYMGPQASKEILTKLGLYEMDLNALSKLEYLPDDLSEPEAQDKKPEESQAAAPDAHSDAGAQKAPENGQPGKDKDTEDNDKDRQQDAESSNPMLRAAEADSAEDARRQTALRTAHAALDFTKYADAKLLGDGDAQQKLRTLESAAVIAEKELVLSKTQFEGTERLAKKDFVTKNDLENERLKVERNQIALETAQTAKALFTNHELLKSAEKMLSDYEEALAKLERTKKLAKSKMAQAAAKRRSAQKRYALQTTKVREINEQIDKCKIRAKRPGLVVYASIEDWRGDDQIREGAQIRERQDIISIPDLSEMAVKVKIHEASIKLIQKEQKARIKVDAYPDEDITGEVVQVGILPDAQNRWMNPDVKVYETKLSIAGHHDWMKPGMSAQVEILVKELSDVLYIPLQAVVPVDSQKVCYVVRGLGQPEKRVIEVGEFNNEYIEVKSGLKEGDRVLLRAPVQPEEAGKAKDTKDGPKSKDSKGKDTKAAPKKEEAKAPEAKS